MNVDTNKYYNYRQNMMGKTVDHDGAYGCQCWDGNYDYDKYLGFVGPHCTSSGYVKDIWLNRKANGMLNNCIEITQLIPGAIVVFKEVPSVTPYSHIAIFDSDVNGSCGRFFGTNQGGKNGAYNITVFPYSAMYDTAFLPKALILPDVNEEKHDILNYIPSDFHREIGVFYPNCTIKIRRAPSLKGKDTGLYYTNGMHVQYDGYVKREGYCWISWIGADNSRRWMACGELNAKGYNTTPYGVFK